MRAGRLNGGPVLLGGAAPHPAFVEQDLADMYDGKSGMPRTPSRGLALMDAVMAVKRGGQGGATRTSATSRAHGARPMAPEDPDAVSDVARDTPVPTPPFWGDRIVKGIAMKEYVAYLDERALFRGQWGLSPGKTGPDYDELVETEGRPRLRTWLSRVASEGLLEAAVIYGTGPHSGRAIRSWWATRKEPQREIARFDFPRQKRGRHLCLADYVRPDGDVLGLQIVTMGSRIDQAAVELFEKNAYRDYLELHGLSVQLTEALAEYWHSRVRAELGIDADDASEMSGILKQKYRGERFAFGYPACPDLSQQKPLVELLGTERVGVTLSEGSSSIPNSPRRRSSSTIRRPAISTPPEALLFDLDGTLLDSELLWEAAQNETMDYFGQTWTDEDQASSIGGPIERVVNHMATRTGGRHRSSGPHSWSPRSSTRCPPRGLTGCLAPVNC